MDKIAAHVLERSNGMCENCYSHGTDLHHIIFGSGKRTQHQNNHSVILLCKECHQGTAGVHGRDGRKLDLKLKRNLQKRYKGMGYTEEETRVMMGGRLY